MTVRVAHVGHGSQPRASPRRLGAQRQRAPRLISGDGMGASLRHTERMLAIDGPLPVVAPLHLGALGHRPASGIGPGARGLAARRAFLHQAALARRTLLEALALRLPLRAGRLLDTGVLAIGGVQLTQPRLHLLSPVLEGLRKFCLRHVRVVDGREVTAIDGQEFYSNEIQRLAQEDNLTA
jgi:hypothetical protein